MSNINVFIVDDSAVVRKVLTEMLNSASGIQVIGAAQDPIFAEAKMKAQWPDVIVLDVEMPRMDGLTFLKKIMSEHPTPIIMCSTLTEEGSRTSIQALSHGALDVVAKPKASLSKTLPEASRILIDAIRAAAKAKISKVRRAPALKKTLQPKLNADAIISRPPARTGASAGVAGPVIAIGTSTGGTQALEAVLPNLPADVLPILVVQHMPEKFTKAFADRLNGICAVEVKEAEDNDRLSPGKVLIAQGGYHMLMEHNHSGAFVRVKDGPLVSRHKPSVDVLFRSVAKWSGNQALGIIMTGMGDDGAVGLREMRDGGALTLAQDEATCVVYGMPAVAVKKGAVTTVVSLDDIAANIVAFSNQMKRI